MINKVLSKGIEYITILILLISFLLVGTPLKENTLIFSMCIIGIGIIFGIYKIAKKEKVFTSKIDIFVLLFYLTPLIPILFNSYANLEDTLIALTKNIALFNIYLMLKERLSVDGGGKEKIINILLVGILILSFFGFDEMLGRTVYRYMKYIGIPNVVNYVARMFSLLCYANTFAVLMAIGMFFALYKLNKINNDDNNDNNSKKVKKKEIMWYIYAGLMYVFILSLIMTYSRSAWLITALMLGICFLFNKDRVYNVCVLLINIILSLIGVKLLNLFIPEKLYIFAWLSVIGFAGASATITNLLNKIKNKLANIKLTTCIYLMLGLAVFSVVVYIVGLKLITPLNIFADGKSSEEVRYKIYNIQPNTDYTISLDIDAKTLRNIDGVYTIEITEENKYYDTIATHSIDFSTFKGNKEIKFKTKDSTVAMVIFFKSNNKYLQDGLRINSVNINGKTKGLSYAYLPINLVEKIESFTLNNKSLWERLVYHKDALKIIKSSPLTGSGANGWKYNYANVQEYMYSASEPHSHILQLIIDNGIVSGMLLTVIVGYVVFVIAKKKHFNLLDAAFILLNIHSIVDFNMSFFVVNVVWIIMFGLITCNNEGNEKKIKATNLTNKLNLVINISCTVISALVILLGISTYALIDEKDEIVDISNEYIKQEKYNEALVKISELEDDGKYRSCIYNVIYSLDYSKLNNESLEYIYNAILEEEMTVDPGFAMMLNRIADNVLKNIAENEYIDKFAEYIVNNNEKVVTCIKNKDVNRMEDKYINMFLEEQKNMYEYSKNVLSK